MDAAGDTLKPFSPEGVPVEKFSDTEGIKPTLLSSSKTTGYKETLIDEASDSEFELRWSDDEDDSEMNAVPLTDEALKKLDVELGLADANTENNKENTQKISTATSVGESFIEIEKSQKKFDKKSSEAVTLAQNLMDTEKPQKMFNDGNSETVKTVHVEPLYLDQTLDETNNETDAKLEQISQNNEPDSHPIQEQLNPIESGSQSLSTEIKVQSNLESGIAILKEDKPMDVDMASVESEPPMSEAIIVSDGQALDKKTLTDLVKEGDVVEENKISEIDIDETIVDLKHLIDQDEDTIKQLGLDVEKSVDKNEPTLKTSVEETKSTKVETESTKIATDIVTFLDTDLCKNPPLEKAKITESTSMSEKDIKTSNNLVKKKDTDNILEKMSSIAKVELNLESEDILSTKESKSNTIEKNDILKSSEDKIDIQHEVNSKIVIAERTNYNTEELPAQKDKGDSNTIAEAPTDQKPVKTDDSVENDSMQKVEKVIGKNVDDIKIIETLSEPNLDEPPENISKVPEKNLDELITPDVSNDLIKINTDHRINRPDVMLDIPTQEFDFDDFDDASEMQGESDKSDKTDNDLTTKTVTEIVNQLAKETESMDTDGIESIHEKETNDIKTKQDEKQFEVTTAKDVEMTSIKNISDMTDKVRESDSTAEKTPVTSQKDNKIPEKDLISTANDNKPEESSHKDNINPNVQKPDNDVQPSTSTEGTKDTQTKIPTTQEDNKLSEVGLKTPEKVVQLENTDPQPSTSEGITEEVQEVTDSLGLLAESIRVIDDDDEEQEPEEDEPDDGDDDDDDFDPDEGK